MSTSRPRTAGAKVIILRYLLSAERVKVMAVWNFDGPGPIDNFLPASTAKSALKVSIYLLHRYRYYEGSESLRVMKD